MPHGHCYLWTPDVLWMHVGADVLVALAYFSIPAALAALSRTRREVLFSWVLWLFVGFIFFCGLTHLLSVWTTWYPAYRLEGIVKVITALMSMGTAVVLWPVVGRLGGLPSAEDLQIANARLAEEVRRRSSAEEQLRQLNRTLEARIAERTAELAQSRKFFQDLYDNAPDMLMSIQLDPPGNEAVTECNRRCADATGIPRAEFVGQPLVTMFHASCHGALRQVLADIRVGNVPSDKPELLLLRRTGEPIDVTVSGAVVEEASDLPTMRISLRDVSETRRTQRVLTRVRVSLAEKQEEVEQLIYTVSHDLKSPVVTCSGFIALCLESLQEGDLQGATEAAARVEKACERLSQLLDDLLQLSRAGHDLQFGPVDTAEVVRDLAQEYAPRLRTEGVELVLLRPMPVLQTDHRSVRLILDNYLTNAIKYGKPTNRAQRIEVGAEQTSHGIRLFVRDNGPGIEPNQHERVFELFQRLHVGPEHGTGLGLAIVRKLARLLGGRVWVESVPEEGAKFYLELASDADAEGPGTISALMVD